MNPVVIDAGAPGNSKMLEAGPEACWLWFQGLCWCRANTRMRGRIPKAKLASVALGVWKPAKLATLAARLVTATLWHDDGDAYRIHEYEQGHRLALQLVASIGTVQTPTPPSPIGGSPDVRPPVQSGAVQSSPVAPWTASASSSALHAERSGIASVSETHADQNSEADALRRARKASPRAVDRNETDRLDCSPANGFRSVDCPEDCVPTIMRGVSPRDSLKLRTAMAGVWDGVGGISTSGTNRHRILIAEPQLRQLADDQGVDPLDLFKAGTARFKADADVRKKKFGLPVFLSQLDQWCAAPDKPGGNGGPGSTWGGEPAVRTEDLR